MSDPSSARSDLLDALLECDGIRAGAVADERGEIRVSRGEAAALRASSSDASEGMESTPEPTDDVYLEALGEDLLIVVFESDCDIDEVRTEVADRRREFDE